MSHTEINQKIIRQLNNLPVELQIKALEFLNALSVSRPQGVSGKDLLRSEYMRQAILYHGALKGCAFGIIRLLRCHPLAKGGKDDIDLLYLFLLHSLSISKIKQFKTK